MSQLLLEESRNNSPRAADEIVIGILEEVASLSALMEVFYFTREPDCLAVLRWVAALPEDERRRLAEFAKSAREDNALRVENLDHAQLLLTLVRR